MRRLGRTFRKGVVVGVVIAVVYALVRLLRPASPGAATAGGDPLDSRPAPAARPEPAEAGWAAAPRVVPEPVPDADASPLAAVLDDMAADAVPATRPAATRKRAPTKQGATKQAPTRAAKKAGAPKKAAAPKGGTKKRAAARRTATWIDPEGRTCPPSHPVKVRAASGIFHVPGGGAYDRTTPDRCYADAAGAESDGYRAAKR